MTTTLIIFLLVYVAMAFGKIPGLRVDRTGAAVVGSLALMTFGDMTPKAAWNAIDYSTIGMLFGLMVVSAAFTTSGFYAWTARRVATLPVSPPALLATLVAVSGLMSALLTNDVVVVAMTPLLVSITLARGLNPIPFLLGFCFAANTGSAGTLIGSPQNMIIAQELGLSFNSFLRVAGLPALLSLPIVWAVIALLYRNRWTLTAAQSPVAGQFPPDALPAEALPAGRASPVTPLNVGEVIKAAIVTAGVIGAFVLSDWPRELIALTGAGILLLSRQIASHDMLEQVDGNLLLLVMGLFVVNAAFANTGEPQHLLGALHAAGINLHDPTSLLLVGGVLSNIVGNNPAVMLLAPFLQGGDVTAIGAALALGTGFFSNLIVFGSLAGIIVVEQAARKGVTISFWEFARAGAPTSMACTVLAMVWIVLAT